METLYMLFVSTNDGRNETVICNVKDYRTLEGELQIWTGDRARPDIAYAKGAWHHYQVTIQEKEVPE